MIAIAWKGTIILATAFVAAGLLRRRSAALRHFLWTAALGALLLLPLLEWRGPVHMANVSTATAAPPVTQVLVAAAFDATPGQPARWIPWLAFLYAAGCALAAAWFLLGVVRTAWLIRRAAPVPQLGADVVTTALAVPFAWGILRPLVALPAAALDWPAARLGSVLLHERMHHRRHDPFAQAIAQAACCLFWFHPLAWTALARQRAERERACDDAVLAAGVAPPEYAVHLMDVVRAMAGRSSVGSVAPAMAETANLESRVRAILDVHRDRRPLNRCLATVVVSAAVALLIPLAALHLRAQAAGGAIAGIVRDPSGAVVPNCAVTAKNLDAANQEATRTDAAGEYRLLAIPAGHYSLEFGARGFALTKANADVAAGAAARVDAQLEVGQVVEAVTVNGERPAPATPSHVVIGTPQRIRVGGMIQASKLLRQTHPVYPPELQQAGVDGAVLIRAVISKDGAVLNPQVLNAAIDPRLAQAALDAVSQWQYTPTLLNGEPIEARTTITVSFQLDAGSKTPR